jgi:hypothetical protein
MLKYSYCRRWMGMRRFARIIGRARSSGMVCKHAYWHRASKRCYQVDCFCSTGSGSNSSYRIGSPRARLHLKPVRAMASRSHCSIVTHKVSHPEDRTRNKLGICSYTSTAALLIAVTQALELLATTSVTGGSSWGNARQRWPLTRHRGVL